MSIGFPFTKLSEPEVSITEETIELGGKGKQIRRRCPIDILTNHAGPSLNQRTQGV